MATINREELLSALNDARPALAAGGIIQEFTHFWFDGEYIYAYDGGLGVRQAFKTELDVGIPGKVFFDLLKTSALKEVFLDVVKETLVLQMGKSKTKLSTLPGERRNWPLPDAPPKKAPSLVLSEQIFEAIQKILFIKIAKGEESIHHGVTVVPRKSSIEFYTTDAISIAQMVVSEKPSVDLPRFVLPWGFVDRILTLLEPGAVLHVMDKDDKGKDCSCLLASGGDVLIGSTRLDLPKDPDIAKITENTLSHAPEAVAMPAGLQPVLERAIILACQDDAVLDVAVAGGQLLVSGDYAIGSIDEKLLIKGDHPDARARFDAALIKRALSHAETFALTDKVLTFFGGEDFTYVLGSKPAPQRKERSRSAEDGERTEGHSKRRGKAEPEEDEAEEEQPRRRRRPDPEPEEDEKPARSRRRAVEPEEDTEDEPPPRRRVRQKGLDDEVPF